MKRTKLEVSTYVHFERFKWFTMIGEGAESKVYSDGLYAYKRCLVRSAYIKWINILEKEGMLKSRHVPKIYEIFFDRSNIWCVVKMELLKMHPNKDISCKHSQRFSNAVFGIVLGKSEISMKSGLGKVAIVTDKLLRGSDTISLDMHHNNVMYRKNAYKTPVITDPVLGDDW